MLQEQNSKSKERLRLEEQRAKYEQKLREQIKKDERRQREREKSLKLLIGELFMKHLPDYMLYEEAEMERIVAAAMGSADCRASAGRDRGNGMTARQSIGKLLAKVILNCYNKIESFKTYFCTSFDDL